MFHAWRILFGSLVKWIILSIVIGGVIGVIASVFANLIAWATDFRMGHMWMVYLLPFCRSHDCFSLSCCRASEECRNRYGAYGGTSDQNTMPGRVAPLILIATALTHLFGGSAGREGAALQFGASLGNWLGRKIHLNESDKRIMTLAGMSAAFAALFGTPMAAALFPMELSVSGYVLCGARSVRVLRIYRRADFNLYGSSDTDCTVSGRRSSGFLWNRGEKRFFWQSVLHLSELCSV